MYDDNLTRRAQSVMDRIRELVPNRVEPKQRKSSATTYAEQVAELTSRLAPGDAAYIEEQGWDRPENIKYLVSYVTAKIEAGEVEV